MKNKIIILFTGLLFFIPILSFSTHIVGGELNYKCLGGNVYEVKLRLYRDCGSGTVAYDNPVAIGVFDANNALITTMFLPFPGSVKLSPTPPQLDTCIIAPANICVEVAEYAGNITLPPRLGGYQLVYQRCCRNVTISNISVPGNVGATYYARIPDQAVVASNTNPVFNKWPPLFLCANKPITFDHSATDADGDSIYYDLCTPLIGGSPSVSQPNPPSAPPYNNVVWKSPYSTANMLGGVPLTIDHQTGLMQGTPNTIGQFVVGVSATEFRNGVLLGITRRDFQFNVVSCPPQQYCSVWPGDTDDNFKVDNNDLLAVGLYYSQTGTPRSSISNSWQGYKSSASWGIIQNNGYDIKYVDCNGDGIINSDDTLAINQNFTLTHSIIQHQTDERTTYPDLDLVSSGNAILGGWINVDVVAGTGALPVDNLYGIAFNINYDASKVQAGTESLTYPNSWLGVPGTNAIKISKIDPLVTTAYGAVTRIDHISADGYGKIATFRFQINTSISLPADISLSFSGYMANDSAGNNMFFNLKNDLIILLPQFPTTVNEKTNSNSIYIFPNPYSNNTTIAYALTKKSEVNVEVYNAIGQKVETLVNTNQATGEYKYQFSAKAKGYDAGVYFVKVTVDGNTTMRRIVEMK